MRGWFRNLFRPGVEPSERVVCANVEAVAHTTSWPDDTGWSGDIDAVPAWRRRAESRALEIGADLPSYRTKREFDDAVAYCRARALQIMAGDDDVAEEPEEIAPPMPPRLVCVVGRRAGGDPYHVAADFAADATRGGKPATFSNDELTAAYTAFCARRGIEVIPENVFRAALKLVPSVTREQVTLRTPKRVRCVQWTIVCAPSVAAQRHAQSVVGIAA